MYPDQNPQPAASTTKPTIPEQPGPNPPVKVAKRFFWRWHSILAVVLILLLGAGVAMLVWLPRLVDARIVVALATKAVEASTGRTLTIKGPVFVQTWPRLGVVAEGVSIGNASWATDTEMATAQRLALALDWGPLLRQSISINQVSLDGLVLNLQSGKAKSQGGNWDLDANNSAAANASVSSSFDIQKILINNATVHYRDSFGNLRESISIDNASGKISGSSVEFLGQLYWRSQGLGLKGKLDYPDGKPLSLSLDANGRTLDLSKLFSGVGSASVPAQGVVNGSGKPLWQDDRAIDYSMIPKMNLQLGLKAKQLLLPNGVTLPDVVLNMGLHTGSGGVLQVEKFTSGLAQGQIEASGTLSGYEAGQPQAALQARAKGFDIADVFTLQKLNLPKVNAQGGALQVDIALKAQAKSPSQILSSLDGHVQAAVGSGSLVTRSNEKHGSLSVKINSFSGRADLAPGESARLNLALNASQLDLGQLKGSDPASVPQAETGQSMPWFLRNETLGLNQLPLMNGRVDLNVASLVLPGGMLLPNFLFKATLEDAAGGRIRVDQFKTSLEKGEVAATASLTGYKGAMPSMAVQAKAKGFALSDVVALQKAAWPNLTAQGGPLNLDLQLASQGATPRQINAGLSGYVQASVGAGSLKDPGSAEHAPFNIVINSFNGRADMKPGRSPQLVLNLDSPKVSLHNPKAALAKGNDLAEKKSRWLFDETPLGLNHLPLMNGRVGISVAEMVLPNGIVLPDFLLNASLQDAAAGRVRVDLFKSGLGGGTFIADGLIDGYTSNTPAVRFRGHARHFRLDRLMAQIDETRSLGQVQGGEGEFAFHMNAKGASPRELASGLDGEFQLSLGSATMPRSMVQASGDFVLSIINTVNPLAQSHPVAELQCLSAYLPAKSGLISINNSIGMQSGQQNILLNGNVNLKQERLNINIQSAQRSGLTTGVNPAGLVTIEGTLMNPSLGVNTTGVVKQAASVGLAIFTGGLSLAAQNVMSVATNSNPCQNILKPWSTIDANIVQK